MGENGSLVVCTDRELLFHGIERMVQGSYPCELVPMGSVDFWLHGVATTRPECLVLDSEMQTAEVIRQARLWKPGVPVVVWQRANSTEASLHALELGASGVLHDSSRAEDIMACLKAIQEGHIWVPQSIAKASLEFQRYSLSPRESQVMSLVSQGLCNKEIAYAMGITEGTTKVYLSRMFDKLGVSDRYALALLGLRHHASSAEHPQSVFVHRPN
ncbi:MAG: two-component system, NarL family, nitrate/nitrite response regulator NarL [Bryobacterales bacterium]|nr:two-component system, NarL family, nitrate/nitrite response regulator NarL [Bryobacterales bacterium]